MRASRVRQPDVHLNLNVRGMRPSCTLAIQARCRELAAEGRRAPDAELTARLASEHEPVVLATLVAIGRAPAASASTLGVVARLVADAAGRVQLAASWACVQILRAHPHLLIVVHDNPSPAVRIAVVARSGPKLRTVNLPFPCLSRIRSDSSTPSSS